MRNKMLVQYQPRHHLITGTPDEVAAVLRNMHRLNRLATDPRSLVGRVRWLSDGRASIQVTLQDPVSLPKRTHPVAREVGVAVAKAAALVAVLGALLILAFYALAAAMASVRLPDGRHVLGAMILVFVAWLLFSAKRGHACKGIHCDGCSRH